MMKKRAISFLFSFIIIFLSVFSTVPKADAGIKDVRAVRNSVVRVVQIYFKRGEAYTDAYGTGFCVGGNGGKAEYIVTNRHVAEWNEEYSGSAYSMQMYVVADNEVIEVDYLRDVKLSDNEDLAVIHLRIPLRSRVPATIGSITGMDVMDEVSALGFPGNAEPEIQDSYSNTIEEAIAKLFPSGITDITVTRGEISKMNVKIEGVNFIQHTADINEGNSGGPLVDSNGKIIGVNTLYSALLDEKGSQKGTVTMYAISVNHVTAFLRKNGVPWKEENTAEPIPTDRPSPSASLTPMPSPTPAPVPAPASSSHTGLAAIIALVLIGVAAVIGLKKRKPVPSVPPVPPKPDDEPDGPWISPSTVDVEPDPPDGKGVSKIGGTLYNPGASSASEKDGDAAFKAEYDEGTTFEDGYPETKKKSKEDSGKDGSSARLTSTL